jgi:hypothetical protein
VLQDNMARIILENGITHVVHFATLLSGAPLRQQQLSAHGLQCLVQTMPS